MPVVSVSMPERFVERLDEFAADHEYSGRSELLRRSSQLLLSEFDDEDLEGRPLAGVVAVGYRYDTGDVDREVAVLRREFESTVTTSRHVHVGGDCVDLLVLEGELPALAAFVRRARSIDGVASVDHSFLPLEPP